MELEKASARLAPRSPWQAVDLGTRLYRQWAGPTLRIWLAFTLPPYLLLLGLAVTQQSGWPLVVFWWLKPLWERPLLAFYSHALFAETLSLKTLLKRWRDYALPGLLAQLGWRRFSPARSFNTPVWQLERAQGEQASARLQVLHRNPASRAGIMMMVLLHLEQFMSFGLMALLYTLMPWQFNLEFSQWFFEQSALQLAVSSLCLYLAMCVTEPLYVACGFALYLNKRTWLEGWDLQLGLTRIGKARQTALAKTGIPALLLAAVLFPFSEPAQAQPRQQSEQQQVIELLANEQYMPFETRTERQWINTEDNQESLWRQLWEAIFNNLDSPDLDTPSSPLAIPDWLLWSLMWAAFAVVALWLLLKVAAQMGFRLPATGKSAALPTHVGGLDIRRQNLPDDIAATIDHCLRRQDIRGALSVLLRASLAGLLVRYPVPLSAGSTEQHCLRTLKQHHGDNSELDYLAALIQAWVRTAWAHRPVTADQVHQLLRDWQALRAEPSHG